MSALPPLTEAGMGGGATAAFTELKKANLAMLR